MNDDRFCSVSACALMHQTKWSFSLLRCKNTQYLSNGAHFSSKSLSNLLKVLRVKWRVAGPTKGEKMSYLSCVSNPSCFFFLFCGVCVGWSQNVPHTLFTLTKHTQDAVNTAKSLQRFSIEHTLSLKRRWDRLKLHRPLSVIHIQTSVHQHVNWQLRNAAQKQHSVSFSVHYSYWNTNY